MGQIKLKVGSLKYACISVHGGRGWGFAMVLHQICPSFYLTDKQKFTQGSYLNYITVISLDWLNEKDVIPHKKFHFYCGVKLPVHVSIFFIKFV